MPPIPGLSDVPFLTNETLFANETLPSHLLIIGGGPIGLLMLAAVRAAGWRIEVHGWRQGNGACRRETV